ncbi:MAG: DUF1501 domain-containing protein [Planctomycetota bacterium]
MKHPLTRRGFLAGAAVPLAAGPFAGVRLGGFEGWSAARPGGDESPGPHFAPRAKRVIYLVMAEGPSQIETFDHKPKLEALFDKDLPDSVRGGQRITTMTSGQKRLPIAPSIFPFAQHGECGTWVSDRLPMISRIVDDITVIRSTHTDAINHDPAITFLMTGSELPGRPSIGAWIARGLGSENRDLPAFVVLHSKWTGRKEAQALYSRLWGSGFLSSRYQGVLFRSQGDTVLYLQNPPGVADGTRRGMLDALAAMNAIEHQRDGDPETLTRMAQYEMAYRMQHSVPELNDLASEPEHVLRLYGPDVATPGTFARNCLVARRLAERGVRFVQIYIRGWDQHFNLPKDLTNQCRDVDHGCFGLIEDLKQRGMLDDTLVVWTTEFGRTVYCQGALSRSDYGRDHHPRCFSIWMAGGGVKRGHVHGATDDFSYNIVADPVHLHDVNATILHCLGLDHERLTYRFQGRDFRLTDVAGRVVRGVLA